MKMKEVDLKSMGIAAKGHRIRLREAIKKLHAITKQSGESPSTQSKQEKLNQLIHPESMSLKMFRHYNNIDIVEEDQANESDEYSNNQDSAKDNNHSNRKRSSLKPYERDS